MVMRERSTTEAGLKAIIIGGGIGGLTCARACLDAGIEVEVYEKRDLDSMLSGPGGIQIQRNAMRVYELLWGGQISDRLYERGGKIWLLSNFGDPGWVRQRAEGFYAEG